MINVLCLFPQKHDATSWYRGIGPMSELKKRGLVNIIEAKDKIDWSDLIGVNLVFIQRPFRKSDCDLLMFAKRLNIKVWIDYDDDILNVQQDNPVYELYSKKETKDAVRFCTQNADAISVSTEALKYLREDAIVIPNSLNLDIFNLSEATHNSNVVLWRGSHTHQKDLMTYRDEFIEISDELQCQMHFVGYKPWFIIEGLANKKWVSVQSLDIIQFHAFLQGDRPKVVVVPLVDNVFNDCKSNIAWIEASMAGALTVAPDKPEWRRPGVFNYTGNESFKYQTMKAFKTSENKHKELLKLSQDDIKENFNLKTNNQRRLEIIERLSK